MKMCKFRLPPKRSGEPGKVVEAEYLHSGGAKGAHVVRYNERIYFADQYPPSEEYPLSGRFVGPAAVLRAV